MNPTVPQSFIDAEYEKDPVSAEAEFGAQFRTDIETYISREAVEAVVEWGAHERGPFGNTRYTGFVDVSRWWCRLALLWLLPTKKVRSVFSMPPRGEATILARGGDRRVRRPVEDLPHHQGDRRPIRRRVPARAYSASTASATSRAKTPRARSISGWCRCSTSGKVKLLGNKRLVSQLIGLERNTARGGRDSIDHARGAHDDVANAVAGALLHATARRPQIFINGRSWEENERHMAQVRARRGGRPTPNFGEGFRFVRLDEQGRELTGEEALAIKNAPLPPRRAT